jgi:hypothetical protein
MIKRFAKVLSARNGRFGGLLGITQHRAKRLLR